VGSSPIASTISPGGRRFFLSHNRVFRFRRPPVDVVLRAWSIASATEHMSPGDSGQVTSGYRCASVRRKIAGSPHPSAGCHVPTRRRRRSKRSGPRSTRIGYRLACVSAGWPESLTHLKKSGSSEPVSARWRSSGIRNIGSCGGKRTLPRRAGHHLRPPVIRSIYIG
jgi:hypothetical protein